MTALDFSQECTDLRHIGLNVINKQKHTYPHFTETLACYPHSRDETLAKDMNSITAHMAKLIGTIDATKKVLTSRKNWVLNIGRSGSIYQRSR